MSGFFVFALFFCIYLNFLQFSTLIGGGGWGAGGTATEKSTFWLGSGSRCS